MVDPLRDELILASASSVPSPHAGLSFRVMPADGSLLACIQACKPSRGITEAGNSSLGTGGAAQSVYHSKLTNKAQRGNPPPCQE